MNERQQQIQALLRTPRVCACGRTHPVSLRALVMEPDGLSRLPEVLKTTWIISGKVFRLLKEYSPR